MQCLLSRLISKLQNRNVFTLFSHVLAYRECVWDVILTLIALGDKILADLSLHFDRLADAQRAHNWLANKNTQTITNIKDGKAGRREAGGGDEHGTED